MASRAKLEQFPWTVATAGAVLVVLSLTALVRLPPLPQARRAMAETAAVPLEVTRVGAGDHEQALQEELVLQDPRPLFLPTSWNSGQAIPPVGASQERASAFEDFLPELTYSLEDPAIEVPQPIQVPQTALAAIEVIERAPRLDELGRREVEVPPLPARVARLEVTEAATGRTQLEEDIAAQLTVPAAVQREVWEPVELLVAVNAAGLVGRPSIVNSSGFETIDGWVLDLVVTGAHLGARLPPGFFRVLVGP